MTSTIFSQPMVCHYGSLPIRGHNMFRFLALGLLTVVMSSTASAVEVGANGMAPTTTTNEFLAVCKKDFNKCTALILTNDIAWGANTLRDPVKYPAYCNHAETDAELNAEVRAVRNWLTAHPETYDRPRDAGIHAAFVALYPCKGDRLPSKARK
jgi:hypothetical protein